MKVIKVVLKPHVKDNNLDSGGKLQPGTYKVSQHGVMSMMPEYREYDGETWGGAKCVFVEHSDLTPADLENTWDSSIMFVYVKVKP